MYNMIFGTNPYGAPVMACLGLRPADVGRFRDVFVEKDFVAVYTRNGGNNRHHYGEYVPGSFEMDEIEGLEGRPTDCDCTGCTMMVKVPKLKFYDHDTDDEFDNTYATIYFKHPPKFAKDLAKIANHEPFDPDQRWHDAIEALGKPTAPASEEPRP